MVILHDRAKISGAARITPEGYFVADALVARANNVQSYYASELGLTDRAPTDVVRVFRPESEVFAPDSLGTLARIPITLDHPAQDGKPVMVDSRNWREFAKGEVGEQVMRDGEYMRITLRVTDAQGVQSVKTDRQEFSLGYGADLRFEAGVHDGEAYDAVAHSLRYNHLAACRTARGGAELRIVDERPASLPPQGNNAMPHIILVDNLPVDVSNPETAATVVKNAITGRDTANAALEAAQTTIAARDTAIVAKDAEIASLKGQVEAAKLTPQMLRDAAGEYARAVANAKRLGATVTDAMDLDTVKATAVRAKMGDKAAAYDAKAFDTAFDTLVALLPDQAQTRSNTDPLAGIVGDAASVADAVTAADAARTHRFKRYASAHEGSKPAVAAQ